MGLTRQEALYMPISELLDMISIHQIKEEGYRYRKPQSDIEELRDFLSLK